MGLLIAAYASASHVEPVLLPGASNQGKTCDDNEGAGQNWIEFKPQPEPPPSGNYSDGTLSVTITYTAAEVFSWSSNIGVDAVIVKGGPLGANLYRYDPPQEATSDTGLTVPSGGVSHISFCYDLESKIIVRKETNPSGDVQSFDFTSNFAGNFSLKDGEQKDSGNINPGTYSVSESAVAGWDFTSATCSDGSSPNAIGLQAGETVTCTFVNTKRGQIVVKKETNPASQQSFAFTASFGNFALVNGGEHDSGLLEPGTYSVAEDVPAGWKLTSATCDDGSNPASIGLAAGETVTCTFVNTQPGTIVVNKETDPSGSDQSFDFVADYGSFSLKDGEQNNSGELDPGSYSVEESALAGWELTSATCDDGSDPGSIALAAGETVTCTFENTQRGEVVVKKVMEGGTGSFEFTGTPSGTISENEGTISATVDPGSYSSSELVPGGWDLVDIECDDSDSSGDVENATADFVVAAGEKVTCTFTNEVQAATIIVEKQTLPDGDEAQFEFSFGESSFSLGDGGQEVLGNLEAGTYAVTENTPEGWDLTSVVCTGGADHEAIELEAGETVTCVFTNTKRGTIVVEKQTSPDGAAGSFAFTGDAEGSVGDGGQIVVQNLVPGTYSSTEGAAAGWILTAIDCDDQNSSGSVGQRTATFELEAGETVTCTFRNSKVTVGQGSIDVQKSANPTTVKEPGGPVTYSVRITNTSTVKVTVTNVVDDTFGDLDDSGGNGCFDVPINLNPGDFSSCQFVGQVTGSAGTAHVNTVTATGNDEFGNPVGDSDDARVDITPLLIDLVIVKTASSPTPLNGIVNYTMTVTNKGPDTATNVQLADPAPAGITYLSATPSQGTCSVAAALVTCNLGTIVPGQVVTVNVTGRATAVGTHVNTATVTGSGGAETNPADNVDSAQTVVPAPLTPPTQPPTKPSVDSDVCLSLVVTPKMIKADGKPDRVTATVRAAKKPMKGAKVLVRGVGIRKAGVTNGKGVARITINPRRPGLITITTIDKRKSCGAKRIGVVGVFLPPVTG